LVQGWLLSLPQEPYLSLAFLALICSDNDDDVVDDDNVNDNVER